MIYNVPEFKPYGWQNYCFHHLKRYNVVVAPRQHGKTTWACELINTVAHAPNLRNVVINLCADTAKRLYTLYSQRLNEMFRHNPLWRWPDDTIASSKVLRADGSYALVNFIGSIAKPTGCTGTPAHLNIIDEAALVSLPFILKSAMPATDKTGGITVVTGTVADNHYRDLFKHAYTKMKNGSDYWFAFYMKFEDKWSLEALNEEKRKAIWDRHDLTDPAQKLIFDTEYMCKWDASHSEGRPYLQAMLKVEDENRIQDIQISQDAIIGTAWDDGRGTTAVWIYTLQNGRPLILGFKEWHASNLVDIAEEIDSWFKDNHFTMGVHCLPHTMQEKAYTLRSQISRKEQLRHLWKDRGAYLPIPKPGSIETKIQAGLRMLDDALFSETNYFTGLPLQLELTKLKRYTREQKKTLTQLEPVYTEQIKKDKHSHAGDSIGELALGLESKKVFEYLNYINITQPKLKQFFEGKRHHALHNKKVLKPY